MRYGMMVSGVLCALGGCVDGAGPAPAPGAPDEPMVERTIVTLQSDGTSQTRTEQVSAAQVRGEIADRQARLAGAPQPGDGPGKIEQKVAALDSCSDGAAMWIFDSDNHVLGTGLFSHEICFIRHDSPPFPVCADLRQYTRTCFLAPNGTVTCQQWAGNTGNWIGSYYSGVDTGYWLDSGSAGTGGFGTYEFLDNAWMYTDTVARAAYICFNNPQ